MPTFSANLARCSQCSGDAKTPAASGTKQSLFCCPDQDAASITLPTTASPVATGSRRLRRGSTLGWVKAVSSTRSHVTQTPFGAGFVVTID